MSLLPPVFASAPSLSASRGPFSSLRAGMEAVAQAVLAVLVLAVLFGGTAAPACAQEAPSDAQVGSPLGQDSVWVNARPYPFAVWGPRAGFGAGAGLVVHNLGLPGSQLLLTAAPAQHDQSATLSFTTNRRPETARRFGIVDLRVRHTDRETFYGIGAHSVTRNPVSADLASGFVRARYGERLLDRRLLIQPQVRLTHTRYRGPAPPEGRPYNGQNLQPVMISYTSPQQHLHDAFSDTGGALPRELTGLVAGLDVAYDTRDRPSNATRGFLARVAGERYTEVSGADLAFDRFDVEVAGWIPLGGLHRIVARGSAAVTRQRSGSVIPFFHLPVLDGRSVPGYDRLRFRGNDRLTLGLLYRFPIYRWGNLAALEGHVGAHAASVYTDAFDQLEASVSFQETYDAGPEPPASVPLRPAVSAGLRAGPLFRSAQYVELAAGWSPEGLSGVRFTFVQPLTPVRAPHHR